MADQKLSIDGGSQVKEFGLGEEEVVEGGGGRIKAQVLAFVAEYFDSLEHKNINSNNSALLVTPSQFSSD